MFKITVTLCGKRGTVVLFQGEADGREVLTESEIANELAQRLDGCQTAPFSICSAVFWPHEVRYLQIERLVQDDVEMADSHLLDAARALIRELALRGLDAHGNPLDNSECK